MFATGQYIMEGMLRVPKIFFMKKVVFLLFIVEVACDYCYDSSYSLFAYYCNGYCAGFYANEYCIYSYYNYAAISGGAIAGLVVGLLAAAAIFIVIVVICVKNCNKRQRSVGRVVGPPTTGTNVAVTNTTHMTGYVQPMNPYGYPAPAPPPPPQYNSIYPSPQPGPPAAYPPQPAGYGAPVQPQYNSIYGQPPNNHMPPAHM